MIVFLFLKKAKFFNTLQVKMKIIWHEIMNFIFVDQELSFLLNIVDFIFVVVYLFYML